MSFFISKEVEFDAGHRVPSHEGKCRNPHGHRYRVRATISGELVTTPGASNEGMLADFGDLKRVLTEKVHDVLDHGFIVYYKDEDLKLALGAGKEIKNGNGSRAGVADVDENLYGWKVIVFPYIPTAEAIAAWTWRQIVREVSDMGFGLFSVDVWETPTSMATYTGPEED